MNEWLSVSENLENTFLREDVHYYKQIHMEFVRRLKILDGLFDTTTVKKTILCILVSCQPFLHSAKHVCMLSRFSRIQLCVTPWTATHQAPLSIGFFRHEYWRIHGFPCPFPALSQEVFTNQHSSSPWVK